MPPEALGENQSKIADLKSRFGSVTIVQLTGSPRLRMVAKVFTWWTLAIEGGIALTFLLPLACFRLLRHFLLIGFSLSTYTVASVIGFGWVLVVMGIACCDRDYRRTRLLYVIAFFALQVYTVPWLRLAKSAATLIHGG